MTFAGRGAPGSLTRSIDDLAAKAGEAAVKDAQPMSENGYKVQLVKVATRRALMSAAGMEVPS